MDWSYVESVFSRDLQFTHASREQILDLLSHLEREVSLSAITAMKSGLAGSWALDRILQFSKCFRVADALTNGRKLKTKLLSTYLSEECQEAVAEALTAERLLSTGAAVHYEPDLPGTTKHPDLFATWTTRQVSFEVVLPLRSARDEAEQQNLDVLLSRCADLLTSGTLNIYFTEATINRDTANSVIAAVENLANHTTQSLELQPSDRAYVTYDPSIRHLPIRVPDSSSDTDIGYAFPIFAPVPQSVKDRLKIRAPMSFTTTVKGDLPDGRSFHANLIVRIHRPAMDPRAWDKAEQEYSQLPPGSPAVVVIDISRTSISLKPDLWAKDIRDSFAPELYARLSAVWLRSGEAALDAEWEEWLILNPYATTKLPVDIALQLIPGSKPLNLE